MSMQQQPGWYTDPLGHADRRWFDGRNWTAGVLDAEGREGVDQLPGTAAPTLPGTVPPPPTTSEPSTWAGAGAGNWSDSGWQAPGRSLPAAVAPTATAAATWSPQPAAAAARTGRLDPVVLGPIGVAIVLFVLSLFVLDWVSSGPNSAGYGDLVGDGASADAFLDKVMIWHYQWLGYLVAAAAVVAVGAFVLGGAGSRRAGHVIAAVIAGAGALLAALAIVRYFRFPGLDPEFGAWLLPAGYLLLLAAVVVSARRTASDR